MPPSLARNFFDGIVNATDTVGAIRSLINADPPKYEDDIFDCKREPLHADKNVRRQNLLEIWSAALCGFANTQGGVIIWGLVAEYDPVKKVDRVTAEELVQDPDRLESDLRKLQVETTDPPLGSVLYQPVKANDTGGFLVCHIPDGPFKPYRQRSCAQQYYYRFGDSFRVIPRHMLQLMFFPRTQARFRLVSCLSWDLDRPAYRTPVIMKLQVELENVGTATAKDVFLKFEHNMPEARDATSRYDFVPGAGWTHQGGFFARHASIHRRMPASQVFHKQWTVSTASPASRGHLTSPSCPNPVFTFEVYCEHQEPQLFQVEYDVENILEEAKPYPVEARLIEPDES
jgi:hypothetical protein